MFAINKTFIYEHCDQDSNPQGLAPDASMFSVRPRRPRFELVSFVRFGNYNEGSVVARRISQMEWLRITILAKYSFSVLIAKTCKILSKML